MRERKDKNIDIKMEKEGKTRESEHRIMLIHNGTSMEPTHCGTVLIIVMFKWLPGAQGPTESHPASLDPVRESLGAATPVVIITQGSMCSQTCSTQVWQGWGG